MKEEANNIARRMMDEETFLVETIVANNLPDIRSNLEDEGITGATTIGKASERILSMIRNGETEKAERVLDVPWQYGRMGEDYDEAARFLFAKASDGQPRTQTVGAVVGAVGTIVGGLAGVGQDAEQNVNRTPDYAKQEEKDFNPLPWIAGVGIFFVLMLFFIYQYG